MHTDRLLVGLRRGTGAGLDHLPRIRTRHRDRCGRRTDRRLVGSQDPDTAVAELHDLISANVPSAIVLGQVLRLPEELPVPEAIDVESLAYSTLLGAPGLRHWLEQRGPRPLPQEPALARRDAERLRITLNRTQRRNA